MLKTRMSGVTPNSRVWCLEKSVYCKDEERCIIVANDSIEQEIAKN